MIDSAAMELVNVSEAARRLGVSRKTVHRRIDAGELQAIDTPDGKRIRIGGEDGRTPAHPDAQEGTLPAAHPADTDLMADRDAWREQAQGLRDTVERLSENVSELNRTLQGQTVRLAQLEGRVLTAQTPQEPPETAIRPDYPCDHHAPRGRPAGALHASEGCAAGSVPSCASGCAGVPFRRNARPDLARRLYP
jgi:excisionase family DNA binding protein